MQGLGLRVKSSLLSVTYVLFCYLFFLKGGEGGGGGGDLHRGALTFYLTCPDQPLPT